MNLRALLADIFDVSDFEVDANANWISGYVDAKISGMSEQDLAVNFPESTEGLNNPDIAELASELEVLLRAELEGELQEPTSPA
ncbi:hypothetical protein CO058_03295 [candidate division WWE3 bacterium CG_4_9_14_0_2_um_filter_35_11]|uniref:Uncharacterized protein n=1 Tax=candidate division WWE3 bacterium CG_4_9_14_0_2_um_filter_35_11 TaxID=1975077 RepID=A0A2M8ELA1_UNCKA|nr:MAG: hypothetical protein COV25_03785 [candidate division WWE3 bacterium CG10_big_fil_rev_8_21_14_0_10_35_32]PJC23509.1 MAG: hypothetical protein CO058_03295 [candidate division WWE3 bacterium CG_4_9_14_0_2_um_filter_35_11]